MNFHDIAKSAYKILPMKIFQQRFVKPMNKSLPPEQRENVISNREILQYIKEDFLSHLFYADSGNYKVFYLTDNSQRSPYILKNDFDKFLYRIQE